MEINGRKIEIYPSLTPNTPIIYLNTVSSEGGKVYQALRNMNCPDFTLVSIGNLEWNHDMAPWDIPPISKNDTTCTGGADEYLQLLTNKIIPQTEKAVSDTPT